MMYAPKPLDVSFVFKAVFLQHLRLAMYVLASLIILAPAQAQGPVASTSTNPFADNFTALKPGGLLHPTLPGCGAAAAGNELRARACYYANDLLGPSAIVHGLFASSMAELRNRPNIWHQDRDDTVSRFGFFYEQKAARDLGEFLAGYLHHENFRPTSSGKTGLANRTKSALLGVVRTGAGNGETEMAFAPIAASLGAGFVRTADYRNRGLLVEGLSCSAASYGFRFGSAVFQEFKPDLLKFSSKMVARFRQP